MCARHGTEAESLLGGGQGLAQLIQNKRRRPVRAGAHHSAAHAPQCHAGKVRRGQRRPGCRRNPDPALPFRRGTLKVTPAAEDVALCCRDHVHATPERSRRFLQRVGVCLNRGRKGLDQNSCTSEGQGFANGPERHPRRAFRHHGARRREDLCRVPPDGSDPQPAILFQDRFGKGLPHRAKTGQN
ncbi:hypothetical protein GCM10007170_21550 [Arthrobacter liuii]|uniref:Uncharacterized protein n=1 Tax=Arthrobacter liuii TaxID=1476996 RepID=A0ABQ2AT74_9MICC|nr:hypothetical protein GCM10007170_21550 [Arthrobacter liuii]